MLLLTGCAAGAVSSAAVPSTAAPLPGTAETAGTAEAAATPAPTADAVQPPQGLVETGAAVLDYDEIRLIDYFREYQPYPDTDYYTMCRDGKWGLMRSDGTEVLPCRASEPLLNAAGTPTIGTGTWTTCSAHRTMKPRIKQPHKR